MSEHAPGPWYFSPNERSGGHYYIRTEHGRETGGLGVAVARLVLRREWGPSVFEANARLIAAAPTLLAALERLLAATTENDDSLAAAQEQARDALDGIGEG